MNTESDLVSKFKALFVQRLNPLPHHIRSTVGCDSTLKAEKFRRQRVDVEINSV